ncbi:hypothetical protein ACTXG5_08295 [Mycobacterium sp. Dal123C01]|uniref:hypothetical protein n=1 Tax=Mycobacterium sp. Dal123C01 TaxID=3457577 RepID=UPI00403E74CC
MATADDDGPDDPKKDPSDIVITPSPAVVTLSIGTPALTVMERVPGLRVSTSASVFGIVLALFSGFISFAFAAKGSIAWWTTAGPIAWAVAAGAVVAIILTGGYVEVRKRSRKWRESVVRATEDPCEITDPVVRRLIVETELGRVRLTKQVALTSASISAEVRARP